MDALSPQFQHCEQEKQDGAENLSNAPDQNEIIEIPAPPQAAKARPYTKQIRRNLGISYCAETPRKPQHGSRHAGNIPPQGDAIDQDEFDIIGLRSEAHTSELQSLMRISYAVFCLNNKTQLIH